MRILEGHNGRVLTLAYAPDGSSLASGDEFQVLRVWDLAGDGAGSALRAPKRRYRRREWVNGLAFAPDGRTLASACGGQRVLIWDVASLEPCARLWGHGGEVHGVGFLPDGRPASVADGGTGEVIVWPGTSEPSRPESLLSIPISLPGPVAASPDSRTIAVGMRRGVCLWSPGPAPARLEVGYRDSPAINTLLRDWGTPAESEEELDLSGSGHWRDLRVFPQVEEVSSLAFSPDGRTLATTDGTAVALWDVPRGRRSAKLEGHAEEVQAVAFSPDGRTIVSGSQDGTVRFWSAADGEPLACLDAADGWINALAFAPDGMTLAAAADEDIYIWDVDEALAG